MRRASTTSKANHLPTNSTGHNYISSTPSKPSKFSLNGKKSQVDVRFFIFLSIFAVFLSVQAYSLHMINASPGSRHKIEHNLPASIVRPVGDKFLMFESKPILVKMAKDPENMKHVQGNLRANRILEVQVLDPYMDHYKSYREIEGMPLKEVTSRDFRHRQSDKWETEECKPMASWQTMQYPSCNSVHEVPNSDISHPTEVTMLGNGYWRDVWKYARHDTTVVLKTMRYMHDYVERNYDRHRRDAMATERLTSADHIVKKCVSRFEYD